MRPRVLGGVRSSPVSEWQVEMLWRCTSCSERNLGRDLACARCGSPKDGSETYEMPGDVSSNAAVRDESLLRIASGGANWACGYCGSDARRHDGACGRCGAAPLRADQGESPLPAVYAVPKRRSRALAWTIGGAIAALFLVGVVSAMALRPRRPPLAVVVKPPPPAFVDVDAQVTKKSWQRTVTIERRQLWPFEGFVEAKPEGAIDVKSLGPRVHHHDSVLDGQDTKTWTEQVPDGYDTQSYTASEACGQTCVSKPQSCKPVCTPGKNGFAKCSNVCSGGGQSCSTKYCTVTKTRQVPRTKTVTKSKLVPRYRQEPRYAAFFSWRAMAWRIVRSVPKGGTVEPPGWPSDEELALTDNERKTAVETYGVTFGYTHEGEPRELALTPADETAFVALPVGTKRKVRVHRAGTTELLDAPAP